MNLDSFIRTIPDFPKKGILYRDITTLLKDPDAFRAAATALVSQYRDLGIQKVVGVESRGFLFGAVLAYELGAGFVPIRKAGKLPAPVRRREYALEYGSDTIEIHKDSISPGERVLMHDDLLATGGTAVAALELLKELGPEIVGVSFLIELTFLDGRKKLEGYDVHSILQYGAGE
ncbi:MAG: adenine phosphoribosyltransferase [Ignavibacteria bacterium]|nr:adenine phosphoribosyltransferase [Ignavibacteria bacterium]